MLEILKALAHGVGNMTYGEPDATDAVSAADVVRWAVAEIERLREERRWVPAGERLPDENVEVLVWGKGWKQAGTAWRQHEPHYVPPATIWTFGDEIDRGFPPTDITHWQPLPPGPEGNANG